MPQPTKNRHGTYELRKVVPKRLRDIVGQSNFKRSLRTKDPRVAAHRSPDVLAELDLILKRAEQALESQPTELTRLQCERLARAWFLQEIDRRAAECPAGSPRTMEELELVADDTLWSAVKSWVLAGGDTKVESLETEGVKAARIACMRESAERLIASEGIAATPKSIDKLALELYAANSAANHQMAAYLEPGAGPIKFLDHIAPLEHGTGSGTHTGLRTLREFFDYWAGQEKLSGGELKPRTVSAYKGYVEHFIGFVGHDDATKVTKADAKNWTMHLKKHGGLSGKPLSAKSIKDSYVTGLRTIYSAAIDDAQTSLKESDNPFRNLNVRGSTESKRRKLTDDEARRILVAARSESGFKRWAPWLMAYTGARVGEVVQLWPEEIVTVGGIPCVSIHDALPNHSTKTNKAHPTVVPLHPHIIEEGFLDYVAACEARRSIFWNDIKHTGDRQRTEASRSMGRFVRNKVGITDRRLAPSHSWRHRSEDLLKETGCQDSVRLYIHGRKPRTSDRHYGEGYTPATLLKTIKKIPRQCP